MMEQIIDKVLYISYTDLAHDPIYVYVYVPKSDDLSIVYNKLHIVPGSPHKGIARQRGYSP